VTDWLTESGGERSGDLRKIPLIPKRAFSIHRWNKVSLSKKKKKKKKKNFGGKQPIDDTIK
jgi:hypothetical protein